MAPTVSRARGRGRYPERNKDAAWAWGAYVLPFLVLVNAALLLHVFRWAPATTLVFGVAGWLYAAGEQARDRALNEPSPFPLRIGTLPHRVVALGIGAVVGLLCGGIDALTHG